MRENILKPFFDKGIISKIYKVLIQLNNKKSKNFQRKYIDGQWVHENVLNNTNHKGNANQKTQLDCHITSIRVAVIKKTKNSKRNAN